MRKKFDIVNSASVKFVTDSDGCVVDSDDLVEIASCQETLMVLCGADQKWSKVIHLICYYGQT